MLSSTKNDEHYKEKNKQQNPCSRAKPVLGSSSKRGVDLFSQFQGALDEETAEKETMHVDSPKQDTKVGIQGEHLNEEKETMPLQSLIQQANFIQQGDDCNEDFSSIRCYNIIIGKKTTTFI
nr:uncharacterized protein LOC117274218 [Nicotiana tomentosiformis]